MSAHLGKLREAFAALRNDLIHADGPRISTMRNYRFAMVQYAPEEEFALRQEVQRLSSDLVANGWHVRSIDLHRLLLQRIRAQGDEWVKQITATERNVSAISPARGLNYLAGKLAPLIEGPDGIAADCGRQIRAWAEEHPDAIDRTVALVGRAGGLYPFYRSSALLRHLDGNTGNVPVVLLYPGTQTEGSGLSFMGVLAPDHDYRPRIYP